MSADSTFTGLGMKTKEQEKVGALLGRRQWGTVREDYSVNGDAWNCFTHDQAQSRAYHWGVARYDKRRSVASGSVAKKGYIRGICV